MYCIASLSFEREIGDGDMGGGEVKVDGERGVK